MLRIRGLLVLMLISILGCSEVQTRPDGIDGISEKDYASVIRGNTARVDRYSGFYQTFQADMTIQSTEMLSAALKRRANFQQWTRQQYQTEREKVTQEATAYSRFFLRFFSPERDYDDLAKDKSAWKIYLDVNGQRFEGKVKKLKEKYGDLQNTYPYLDRFSTPYELTFSVPMTTIEQSPSKVTLASTLGTAEFSFPGKK